MDNSSADMDTNDLPMRPPIDGRKTRVSIGLRALTEIMDVVGIILIGRAMSLQQYYFTDSLAILNDIYPMCAFVASFVWTSLSLGFMLGHVHYHPGMDVGLDLVSFLIAVIMFTVASLNIWNLSYMDIGCRTDLPKTGRTCDGSEVTLLPSLERAGTVLCLLIALLHFVIFFRACMTVHHQRIAEKRTIRIDFGTWKPALTI